MKYAKETSVSVASSRAEIETTIQRYGADAFATAMGNGRASIQFRINGLSVRFDLPLPGPDDKVFTHYRRSSWSDEHKRTEAESARRWEQACRQRWRALSLCIKAKLEAVECGITTFEEEFLAHVVMPDGGTFGRVAIPQIQKAIADGRMPQNLLGFDG